MIIIIIISLFSLHLNFLSLELRQSELRLLQGLKKARTSMNCKKFTLSLSLSSKKALTILSQSGFMANSGILRKSSLSRVPQSPLSKLVKRLYNLSIWLGVTKINEELIFSYDICQSCTYIQKIFEFGQFLPP